MRTIDDGDVLREYNTRDLVELFQDEILAIHKSDVDDWEADLMTNQYAYIKFGLLLERVRNGCWWNRCKEKFADFRSFCQRKINLNIWQVANAIKSARVAVKLAHLGFEQFPRNASQALKLADLPADRLAEVWEKVVRNCEGHKITALAIEKEIDPDKQPTNSTLRLPAGVVDGLTRQAIEYGLTLQEYLKRLASGEDLDPGSATENPEQADDEQVAALDALDLKFQALRVTRDAEIARSKSQVQPQKIIEATVDSFDRLMNGLIGQFIPPVRRVANE